MWTSDDELQNLGFGTDGSPGPCPPSVRRFPFKPLNAFSRLNVSNDSFLFAQVPQFSTYAIQHVIYWGSRYSASSLHRFSMYHFQSGMQNVWIYEHKQNLNTCVTASSAFKSPSCYEWASCSLKMLERRLHPREGNVWNAAVANSWRSKRPSETRCDVIPLSASTKFAITQIWHNCSILSLWERNGQIIKEQHFGNI